MTHQMTRQSDACMCVCAAVCMYVQLYGKNTDHILFEYAYMQSTRQYITVRGTVLFDYPQNGVCILLLSLQNRTLCVLKVNSKVFRLSSTQTSPGPLLPMHTAAAVCTTVCIRSELKQVGKNVRWSQN